MSNQSNKSWVLLQEQGIVQGEQPENKILGSPWYVKALLAFSGWLAAIFILGFIGAAFQFVFDNPDVVGIFGLMMVAGAFGLLRVRLNEFVEHLGLATSMAGQALIIYAIFDLANHNEIVPWLLLSIFEVALVALMPNFVHSVVSALVAAITLTMALTEMHIPYIVGGIVMFGTSFCWLNEFRYPQQMKKIRAIGYGLVLALVALKGTTLFGNRTFGRFLSHKHEFWAQPWLGELMIGVVTLYVVWSLLQRYGQPVKSRLSIMTLFATLLICTVSINVQGITVGIVIVCLGYFCANRVLLGLGIVSLLFYISSYYYLLDTTLMDKSQSLLVVGLFLLFVRWLILKVFHAHNEVHHA
jgi:uncharacterized membrane protein